MEERYVVYVIGGRGGGDYFRYIGGYISRRGLFKKVEPAVWCTNKADEVKIFLTKSAAQAVVDEIHKRFPKITSAEVLNYNDADLTS